jgi:hypothetical protein
MADIKFFMTFDDFLATSEFIYNTFDANFIPEISVDNPNGEILSNCNEILNHLDNFPKHLSLSYFLTSPLWSVEPLYFSKVIKDNTELHYVIQKYGGPAFHFIPSFSFPNFFDDKIISGMISDYSYYISGSFLTDKVNGYRTINRSDSMTKAHNEIKKFIIHNSKKVTFKGNSIRIARAMTGASEKLIKGYELLEGNLKFK